MSEEILVNVTPMETRVAVLESGILQDIHIERTAIRGLVGNIYAGTVVRVMPGMQAAFVELAEERTGFLHVSDLVFGAGEGRHALSRDSENIHKYLHQGKKVIVQVIKDPIGSKGARLTAALSVSSRYLVFMPHSTDIGISQRIEDAQERKRLEELLGQALVDEDATALGGFILRTAAEGVAADEILADLRYLQRLWTALSRRGKEARKPTLIYQDLTLDFRTIRDLARPGLDRIVIDNAACFDRLQHFCQDYVPEVAALLELYDGDRPLFDLHGTEDEIKRALERRVELKSGGYLIIDQTEAMTTVDVNTGSFVGKKNLEETIYRTNLEAAVTLARQLRVRNLGGIIIVDFIDMYHPEHKREVLRVLAKAMQSDPARNKIAGISDLGLVEMTRKRERESLSHTLCEECPVCAGRGVVKSAETVCYEILREIMGDTRTHDKDTLLVLAAQNVVDCLLDQASAAVADLAELIGKRITFRVEPGYAQEHFDIVLL